MFRLIRKESKSKRKMSVPELVAAARKHSISMQRKLLLYLCMLVTVVTCILAVILFTAGSFAESGKGFKQSIEVQLKNSVREIEERLGFLVGNCMQLSNKIASSLEDEVLSYPYDIYELNDNRDKLLSIQQNLYPLLENQMKIMRVSGIFTILDATVNTHQPNAITSRSGLYLRLANVSGGNSPNNEVFLFRGNSEVSTLYHIQMHNRWNMEFDIKQMEWYKKQISSIPEEGKTDYLWIGRRNLSNLWERAAYLSLPVFGSNKEAYGACGVEISSILFRYRHPPIEGNYGNMVTVFAPVEDNKLDLSAGLIGETDNIYINDNETLKIKKEKHFNIYIGKDTKYIGSHHFINELKSDDNRKWAITVLMPYSVYEKQANRERWTLLAIISCFVLLMLALSYFISRCFVNPIVKRLEELKDEEMLSNSSNLGISEIDALIEFMKVKRTESLGNGREEIKTPSNIESLFDQFIENAKGLTVSERNILRYYMDGYEISEIPELACVSMNTVRKHNRNIYEKLGIKSKDELNLYLDLLKRCGRIDELK